MDIKTKEYYGKERVESVKDFVVRKLDGCDYERGAIETIEKTAENATEAIGRLCEILAEKSILSADDIVRVVSKYPHEFNSASFSDEKLRDIAG